MPDPKLYQSFTVPGVNNCYHMSCLTPDRVLVNDYDTTILTNTTGDILFYQKHLCGGPHTLNSEYELIYIDMYYNICKLSKNLKTTTIIIPIKDFARKPQCTHWSASTGDLLVGVSTGGKLVDLTCTKGKVARYDQNGHLTQLIQRNIKGKEIYRQPRYITENKNSDIVVSDSIVVAGAVVVTFLLHRTSTTFRIWPTWNLYWRIVTHPSVWLQCKNSTDVRRGRSFPVTSADQTFRNIHTSQP